MTTTAVSPNIVAILGTGLMGSCAALRFANVGAKVRVWNRTVHRAVALVGDNVMLADTPAEAVRGADVVVAFLHDGPASLAVLLKLGAAVGSDARVYDMGTNTPCVAQKLAVALGAGFADAPVSGGITGLEAGTLRIFLGATGARSDIAARDLQALGCVTPMGCVGAGQAAKLANQVIVAGTIAALAEGLALAGATGVDLRLLLTAMQGGFADGHLLRLMGPRMATGDFAPRGRSSTHFKDLELAMAAAHGRLTLTATDAAKGHLARVLALYGDLDHSAMFLSAALPPADPIERAD